MQYSVWRPASNSSKVLGLPDMWAHKWQSAHGHPLSLQATMNPWHNSFSHLKVETVLLGDTPE